MIHQKILEWEKSFLGLELISSGLDGDGVGLATDSFKEFKKGEIIAQFLAASLLFQSLQQMKFLIQNLWETIID